MAGGHAPLALDMRHAIASPVAPRREAAPRAVRRFYMLRQTRRALAAETMR